MMNTEFNRIKVCEGVYLQLAYGTTKVCPYCSRYIEEGLYHVTMRVRHRKSDGTFYTTNNIHIHVPCFKKLSDITLKKVHESKEVIDLNLRDKGAGIL